MPEFTCFNVICVIVKKNDFTALIQYMSVSVTAQDGFLYNMTESHSRIYYMLLLEIHAAFQNEGCLK